MVKYGGIQGKIKRLIIFLFPVLFLFLACPTPDPPPPITTTSTTTAIETTTTTTIEPEPIPEPSKPHFGASFYQLETATSEDIIWFISQVRANGGNATEIFLIFEWSGGWKNSPYKIVDYWSEEKYGDYKFPMFDLDQWDESYWTKLKLIMELCRDNGIALFMRVQDYCSLKDPFAKRHYPYNNHSNIQEYTGGTWGEPVQYWYALFNQRLIQTINEVGLTHYFIIPMNEADVLGDDPGDTPEWKDEVCQRMHQFYIDDFMSRSVKKSQLIMNIDRPNVRSYFASQDYLLEIHGIASPESLANAYQEYGYNIFPNGDGATCGHGCSSHGYSEPDSSQATEIRQMIVANNGIGYLCFLRKTEETEIANVRRADFSVIGWLANNNN